MTCLSVPYITRSSFYKNNTTNLREQRHLCYRNFLIFMNSGQPIGRGNRVVLPQSVVAKIREQFPDPSGKYVGFSDSMGNM